ncbi:MAG TPA: potassium-transporting ATPase subunit KdpC [Thermoanaerobaculaceae bacterium]|nr:potassium-transporting ATPase subunit KdpC [Thermoanaerobaculaceae bacterium]
MLTQLRPALVLLVALHVLTGIVYPLVVTGAAQAVWHDKAEGSVVTVGGKAVGSSLIGQPFSAPEYFWSRPSATSPAPYDASGSTGSNLGPTNPALLDAVRGRIAALRQADPKLTGPIPVDLVTTSGSGLDPDVSVAAALVQVNRVAAARGVPAERVRALVLAEAEGRTLGFLGEPRVNVLRLNLALDAATRR